MRDREFIGKLTRLALPICFQAFMLSSVAAADAFMLGSVEQNMMSAVSLATQIQFIQNMILSATVSATVVLGAQYWGKHDMTAINDIFCLCLRICGIASILFFIGCICFPEFLMSLYTNEKELIAIGSRYLRIAGYSYLLTGVSQCYLAMMKITEHTPSVAMLSGTAVVLNIIFNAVLIYKYNMGAEGAAWATLVSRIVELTLAVILSYKSGYVVGNDQIQ